jgi:hypothetical protein
MATIDPMIITINVLLYGTAFILGFILGKITTGSNHYESIDAKDSFFKPQQKSRKKIEIDEKKFVTAISTNSLEKKGKELGSQTIVDDDVAAAASKLAMLKKK